MLNSVVNMEVEFRIRKNEMSPCIETSWARFELVCEAEEMREEFYKNDVSIVLSINGRGSFG